MCCKKFRSSTKTKTFSPSYFDCQSLKKQKIARISFYLFEHIYDVASNEMWNWVFLRHNLKDSIRTEIENFYDAFKSNQSNEAILTRKEVVKLDRVLFGVC